MQKDECRRLEIGEPRRLGLQDTGTGSIDDGDRDEVGDVPPVSPKVELPEIVRPHNPDEAHAGASHDGAANVAFDDEYRLGESMKTPNGHDSLTQM